jgi:hypothetical protein
MTENQAADNSIRSLEFDMDVILNDDPRLPASVLPRMIAAADDQQTLSTLDRDQSLLTQDEPPLMRAPPNYAEDRFVDEEAPSQPIHRDGNKKLTDDPQTEADEDLHDSGFSIRVLFFAAFVMSILLLAVITGLAIWLINVKTTQKNEVVPSNGIDQTADDDLKWFPLTSSPNSSPTEAPSVATTTTPFPLTPAPSTSTLGPTDDPIPIQQARARFLNILIERSYSLLQTLQQPESRHFQAYEWLIRDPNFFNYSSDRIIQRWVLALFAMGLSSSSDNATQQKQSITSLPPPLQTWVQYTDECTWFHSNVDSDTLCNDQGQYVRIDLRSLDLSGTLPSEIALLSNSLGKLRITFSISQHSPNISHHSLLRSLISIEFIFLYDNQFHGTLPTHLGLLHKLGKWLMDTAALYPDGRLIDLSCFIIFSERLQVTQNLFEGTIPTETGQLDNLVLLGVGVNALAGPLPSEMGQLERLRK